MCVGEVGGAVVLFEKSAGGEDCIVVEDKVGRMF